MAASGSFRTLQRAEGTARRALQAGYGVCILFQGQVEASEWPRGVDACHLVHRPRPARERLGPGTDAGTAVGGRVVASVQPRTTEAWTEVGKFPLLQTPVRQVWPPRLRDGMTLPDGVDAAGKMGTKGDEQRHFPPCHGLYPPRPRSTVNPRTSEHGCICRWGHCLCLPRAEYPETPPSKKNK